MYNKIIIAGHLSKDIELRYSQAGTAIANTAVATSRKYKSADGTQKDEVLFVDVTFYGCTAEVVNQYLHKGSKVLIDGRLRLEQWTAQDGTKRSKHKIDAESVKMLDGKPDQSQPEKHTTQDNTTQPPATAHQEPKQQPAPAQPHPAPKFPDMDEDEIPF